MANTYINIYLHIVFAVKYRDACIDGSWRERLYAYISSIFKAKEQFVVKIGGVSDHIHMLISYNAKVPLPDLIRDVKSLTTNFINKERLVRGHFSWQKGYACLSYSQSQIGDVVRYIDNQAQHHGKFGMQEELRHMLDRYNISYDDDYLFAEPE
ncbi:MAG: IS200/IS605 family transposase [Muribaculaceae bacterium]|nr:IS200/IS605 family transposase [Muribaculaceae bacterium]